MNILYLLLALALVLMAAVVGLFLWTVRNGQYEDLDGPAHRILFDDDDDRIPGGRTRARPVGELNHPDRSR